MPNLKPPILTCEDALAYRKRILAHAPKDSTFEPLMTLYLTETTSNEDVLQAANDDGIAAIKYYPAGATTNSASGVINIEKCYANFELMAENNLLLLIHGEVTDPTVDIFDREKVFIDVILEPLLSRFPTLKVVLEHISTQEAAQYVMDASDNIAATITPQHLLYNRNNMLSGGIRPHLYCLPILKRNCHQEALVNAATSGHPRIFLGTDSAPHLRMQKENDCGCAGCYSAPFAMELYAEIFSAASALDKLEGFASHFGADFYGLPRNQETITLLRKEWQLDETFELGEGQLVPLHNGQPLQWQLANRGKS